MVFPPLGGRAAEGSGPDSGDRMRLGEGLALCDGPPHPSDTSASGLVSQAKLRPRNRSAEEGEPAESKSSQKEPAVQRSKSCKVPGLGKPLALPPKPEKSSGWVTWSRSIG